MRKRGIFVRRYDEAGSPPGGVDWLAGVSASVRLGRDRRGRRAAWLIAPCGRVVACLGYRGGEVWHPLRPRGGGQPACPFPVTPAAAAMLASLSLSARHLLDAGRRGDVPVCCRDRAAATAPERGSA
jgi:hypothetical protein